MRRRTLAGTFLVIAIGSVVLAGAYSFFSNAEDHYQITAVEGQMKTLTIDENRYGFFKEGSSLYVYYGIEIQDYETITLDQFPKEVTCGSILVKIVEFDVSYVKLHVKPLWK